MENNSKKHLPPVVEFEYTLDYSLSNILSCYVVYPSLRNIPLARHVTIEPKK